MRNVGYLVAGCVATLMLNGAQAGPISEWAQPDITPEEFRIMTPAEEAEYRARMAELSGEAREVYRNQQYERLRERARAQGYELSEIPPWGRNKVLPPSALADASQPEAAVSPAGEAAGVENTSNETAGEAANVENTSNETAGETGSIVKRGFHTLKEKLGFGAKPTTSNAEQPAGTADADAASVAPHLKSEKQMNQGMADYRAAMQKRQESYLKARGLEIPAKTATAATAPPPPVAAPSAPEATTAQAPRDPRAEAQMKQRQNDYRARMQARQASYLSKQGSSTTKEAGMAAQPEAAASAKGTTQLAGPAAAAAAMAAATSIGPAEVAAKVEQTAGSVEKVAPETPADPAAAAMKAATAAAMQQTHFYGKEPGQDAADSVASDDALPVEPSPLTLEQMEKALSEQRDRERARFENFMKQKRLQAPPAGSPADRTAASAQNDEAMQQRMNLYMQQMKARHESLLERMRQAKTEGSEPSNDQPAVVTESGSKAPGMTPQTANAERMADDRAKMKERFEHYRSERSSPPGPPMPPMPGGGPEADSATAGEDPAAPDPEEQRKLIQERIDAAISSLGQRRAQPPRRYYPPMPPSYGAPGGYGPRYPTYPNYANPYQTPYWRSQ